MDAFVRCAAALADLLDRSASHRLADAVDSAFSATHGRNLSEMVQRLLSEVRDRIAAGDPSIDRPYAEWFLNTYDNQHLFPSRAMGDYNAAQRLRAILDGPYDLGFGKRAEEELGGALMA